MRRIRLVSILVLAAVIAAPATGRGPDEDVTKFLAQLKDPKTQAFAKDQIADEVGKRAAQSKAAVPGLIELLKDPENARFAARGLGAAGSEAKDAVAPMLAILMDPAQAKARTSILIAVGKIKPPDPKAFVEAVTPFFTKPEAKADEFTQHCVLEALAETGPGAKDVAPLLYAIIKDENFLKREVLVTDTLKAIGQIQLDPKDALPAILPLLDSKSQTVARAAAKAYVRLAPPTDEKAKAIMDRLIAAYTNKKDRGGRGQAVVDLEDLGPAARAAVPAIAADLKGKNFNDRGTAVRLLTKIGPEAKEAIPIVLEAASVKENWPIALGNLLNVIPLIGGKKTDQLPVLIAVMEDYVSADGMYHPKAKAFPQPWQGEMLGRIRELGPDGAPAAAAVAKLVEYHQTNREGGQSIIVQAMQTLGEMGPAAKEAALPVLLKSKGDFTADEAIKKINDPKVAVKPKDPTDKPKDPAVKPKDPEKPVVADPEKTKELVASLKDPAKRKEAILGIAALGVQGRVAEPALVEMLRDPDREIRLLAAYALEKLESAK